MEDLLLDIYKGSNKQTSWRWLLFVIGYCGLLSIYFVIRYNGQWIDTDTAVLTHAINAINDEGTLIPKSFVYGTGYVYQIFVVFISNITGLSAFSLQTLILPIIGCCFGSIPIFLLCREYIGKSSYAALATILLYAHPDFLYVSLRGSHEKITWPIAALCIFSLIRSYKSKDNIRLFIIYTVLFYLSIFTLSTTNFFFATSFVLALVVSMLIGLIWLNLFARNNPLKESFNVVLRRYFILILSSTIVLTLVAFYVYPPSQDLLLNMKGIYEKIFGLFVSYKGNYDTYSILSFGWVNRWVYLGLTLINFFVAGVSFVTLIVLLKQKKYQTTELFLLLLFYLAFGIQIFFGILLDFSGSLGANLQLRLIPAFMLSAIPLAVIGLKLFFSSQIKGKSIIVGCLPFLLALFTLSSVIKATNDPLFSNYWSFYSKSEISGISWTGSYLQRKAVWVEFDGVRLVSLWNQHLLDDTNTNYPDAGRPKPSTSNFLISDIMRRWSNRQSTPLPIPSDALQIYDNGGAQLYHIRPLTPYQE